ncbi:MAG: hypothetical protein ACJAS4_000088 [Bacteriovoracaceae bacterium]|jgi:hypothetical protein
MKKLILSLFILIALVTPVEKANALDPKGRAFLIICTYGTVGGALLGFATMAFGTNSRAIAQGASLGLYAGIGFGSYIIMSHRKSLQPIPEPSYNPQGQGPPPGYGQDQGGFGQGGFGQDQGGFGAPPPEDSGGFFGTSQRFIQINEDMVYNYKLKNKKGREISPPIYLPLYYGVF